MGGLFSKEEFKKIVSDIIIKLLTERTINPLIPWEEGEKSGRTKLDRPVFTSIGTLMMYIIEIMIKDYGFKSLKHHQVFMITDMVPLVYNPDIVSEKDKKRFGFEKKYCRT